MYDIRKNTKRLINSLDAITDNKKAVQVLAQVLEYDPQELVQDINSAFSFYEQHKGEHREQ